MTDLKVVVIGAGPAGLAVGLAADLPKPPPGFAPSKDNLLKLVARHGQAPH